MDIHNCTFSIRTWPGNSYVPCTSFPSYAKLHIKSFSTVICILIVGSINNCCNVKPSSCPSVWLFSYILTAVINISPVIWLIALYRNKHALSHTYTAYTHMHSHTYIHACTYTHIHIHTLTYMYTHSTHAHNTYSTHTCTYTCMYYTDQCINWCALLYCHSHYHQKYMEGLICQYKH